MAMSMDYRLEPEGAVEPQLSALHMKSAALITCILLSACLGDDEDLDVLWSRAKRYGQRYSVAICDIDHFKKYNDRYGHLAGDQVLRSIAQTIRRALRQGDVLYRYGGEEFVAVLPEQPVVEAASAMNRVRDAIERLGIAGAEQGVVTISVGVAELDATIDANLEAWLRRADAALYRAKANGRNRVELDGTTAAVPAATYGKRTRSAFKERRT